MQRVRGRRHRLRLMAREARREENEETGRESLSHAREREKERTYDRGVQNERDGETTNPRLRHVERA